MARLTTRLNQQLAIRRSWRQPPETIEKRWRRRWAKRAAVSLLALILLALMFWVLLPPFWHPNTHLVLLTEAEYRIPNAPPLEYSSRDIDSFDPLSNALYVHGGERKPVHFGTLSSVAEMQSLGDRLKRSAQGHSAVLIVYAAAHGICVDGEPLLLCGDFDPADSNAGRYPIDAILQDLADTDAAVKLLILDAGRLDYDPRLGVLANQFPKCLEAAVARKNDPRLWVLTSNDSLERSFVSPAVQRSVFGFFVTRALSGAADMNDDRVVDLDELHRFVSANVSGWIQQRTDGEARQTPRLLAASGQSTNPVLISISKIDQETAVPDLGKSIQIAQAVGQNAHFGGRPVIWTPDQLAYRAQYRVIPPGGGAYRSYYAYQQSRYLASAVGDAAADEPAGSTEAAAGESGAEDSKKDSPFGPSETDAKDETKEEAEAAEPEKPEEPKELATPPLLIAAWKLRDEMASPDYDGQRPADFAPHLWREYEQELANYEIAFRGSTEEVDSEIAKSLKTSILPLPELLAEPTVSNPLAYGVSGRVASAKPRGITAVDQPYSLAILSAMAGANGPPVGEELQKVIEALDAFTKAEAKREDFEKWVAELPSELDRFVELRHARRLASLRRASWRQIQSAIQARRYAEQVVASHTWISSWLGEDIATADRLLLAGERELADQVGDDAGVKAMRLLAEADMAFRNIDAKSSDILAAMRLSNDLAIRAPFYSRWHRAASLVRNGGGPSVRQLVDLLRLLRKLDRYLIDPDVENVNEVRELAAQLVAARDVVESGLRESVIGDLVKQPVRPGDSQRIEALLATPLLAAPSRIRLLQAVNSVDALLSVDYREMRAPRTAVRPQPAEVADWRRPREQVEIEFEIARLASLANGPEGPGAGMKRLKLAFDRLLSEIPSDRATTVLDAAAEKKIWNLFDEFGLAVRDFYSELPARIAKATEENSDLSDAAVRSARLTELRKANQALRMVDPRDTRFTEEIQPGNLIRQAEIYDLLIYQVRRSLGAVQDSSAREIPYLTAAAAAYRRQALAIPSQPTTLVERPSRLSVQTVGSLSLTSTRRRQFDVDVRYEGASHVPTWVVLKYDPDVVSIRPTEPLKVYDEYRLVPQLEMAARTARLVAKDSKGSPTSQPGAATKNADQYPYNPRSIGEPATFSFPASGRRTIGFIAEYRKPTPGDSRIIVKVIAGDDYVRRDIQLELPAPETTQLLVDGVPGTWMQTVDGFKLLPFANRSTPFRFSLLNRDVIDQSVDVQIFAPGERISSGIPAVALSPSDAEKLLAAFGDSALLAEMSDVSLAANGPPVTFPFPKPDDAPPPAAEPAEDTPPAKPAFFAGSADLEHGLLVVLTDRGNGWKTIKRIQIEAQRPQRFLAVQVGYDLRSERLKIRVTPQDRDLLPRGPIKLSCEIVEPIAVDSERRLEAELRGPNFAAEMYAAIPADLQQTVTLRLNVDGFPRAFIYRVPCWMQSNDVPPESDTQQIRITSLPKGENYTPSQSVPVAFEVDAPIGAFQNDVDVVEIGIDADRDRELDQDEVLQLYSDRQLQARLEKVAPDGTLSIFARVTDFLVELPPPGLQNSAANVVGQLIINGQSAWSEPRRVVFDDLSPKVHRIEIVPGRVLASGEEAMIYCWAVDNELTGVDKLEVGLDVQRTGEFADDPKPIAAFREPSGRWVAKLPTGEVPPGKYSLLVRATDRVGNSAYTKYDVRILSEQEVEAAKSRPNRVRGTVQFGGRTVADAIVWMIEVKPEDDKEETGEEQSEPKTIGPVNTNAQGAYVFNEVPPGEYVVRTKSLLHNKWRYGEQAVKVEAAPAPVDAVNFEL